MSPEEDQAGNGQGPNGDKDKAPEDPDLHPVVHVPYDRPPTPDELAKGVHPHDTNRTHPVPGNGEPIGLTPVPPEARESGFKGSLEETLDTGSSIPSSEDGGLYDIRDMPEGITPVIDEDAKPQPVKVRVVGPNTQAAQLIELTAPSPTAAAKPQETTKPKEYTLAELEDIVRKVGRGPTSFKPLPILTLGITPEFRDRAVEVVTSDITYNLGKAPHQLPGLVARDGGAAGLMYKALAPITQAIEYTLQDFKYAFKAWGKEISRIVHRRQPFREKGWNKLHRPQELAAFLIDKAKDRKDSFINLYRMRGPISPEIRPWPVGEHVMSFYLSRKRLSETDKAMGKHPGDIVPKITSVMLPYEHADNIDYFHTLDKWKQYFAGKADYLRGITEDVKPGEILEADRLRAELINLGAEIYHFRKEHGLRVDDTTLELSCLDHIDLCVSRIDVEASSKKWDYVFEYLSPLFELESRFSLFVKPLDEDDYPAIEVRSSYNNPSGLLPLFMGASAVETFELDITRRFADEASREAFKKWQESLPQQEATMFIDPFAEQ